MLPDAAARTATPEVRRRDLFRLGALAAGLLLVGTGQLGQSIADALDTKTANSGARLAKRTGVACVNNICKDSNGCATCVTVQVLLPLNATVVAIRYYHNAGYPNDGPLRTVDPGDVAWSYMETATQFSGDSNLVVQAHYFNRSEDRDRVAALEVDWK